MKLRLCVLILLVTTPLLAQVNFTSIRVNKLENLLSKDYSNDSLIAKRRFLTTIFYRNGVKLPRTKMIEILGPVPQSLVKYRQGTTLNTIAPFLALSGLVVGYIGIKGRRASDTVRGKYTVATPYPPSVDVDYTVRSLPKFVAGLGIFAGGVVLVELSNELITRSVEQYNSRLKTRQATAQKVSIHLGITPSAGVGMYALF